MASADLDSLNEATGIRGLWQTWERFWFSPGDPTTLGFMRLLGGFLIFYIHLSYSFDLQTFFGRDAWVSLAKADIMRKEVPMYSPGVNWDKALDPTRLTPEDGAFVEKWGYPPDQSVGKGRALFSLWYHLTDPTPMAIAHTVILITMFLFAIGFCSRVTGVLTWVFLLFYINRSNASVFGVDTMMNILAIYLIIGPSGAAFSVDRLIERWIAARRGKSELPPPAPSVSANLSLRLIQVNFCLVYGMSGLSKLQGGSWWSGTATWLTMVNFEFSPLHNHLYVTILRYIAARRWLWELVMQSSTMMTLILELTMPLMIWNRRLRWLYICGCSMFHLSIAVFMSLVCFSSMMLILLLSFVPGWTIRAFFSSAGARFLPASKSDSIPPPKAPGRLVTQQVGSR
jgi:Vitamin K-dependent gamma-carboxylase